ncbi:hypothetical protein FRC08_012690 [Ceratobasidium sp. 394]|nr:hypothetical protein FRC08_012690 [Ceratobasidium sp. 394]
MIYATIRFYGSLCAHSLTQETAVFVTGQCFVNNSASVTPIDALPAFHQSTHPRSAWSAGAIVPRRARKAAHPFKALHLTVRAASHIPTSNTAFPAYPMRFSLAHLVSRPSLRYIHYPSPFDWLFRNWIWYPTRAL